MPFFLRYWLARRLASRRWREAAENYQRIGGSPMLGVIQKQCRALQDALEPVGEVRVYPGMRYWHPFIADTMARIRDWDPDRVVALPLFPHACSATTGTTLNEVWKHAGSLRPRLRSVPAYFEHPDYLAAVQDTIVQTLRRGRAEPDTLVLFSAHGVPQRFVDRGDPYVHQIRQGVERIATTLPHDWRLSFQSRVGKARWYGDFTLDVVADLGRRGVRSLAVVPISFTSENVETRYELDILVRETATSGGIVQYLRAPTVDDHPLYIRALAGLVQQHLA